MAAKILPSVERLRELLDYDPETGELTWRQRSVESFASVPAYYRYHALFCGKVAGTKASRSAAQGGGPKRINVSVDGVEYAAHNIIWLIVNGTQAPSDMEIDHKNCDPWDNRLSNLRLSTHTQNMQNGKNRKRDLPRGVYRKHGKYTAAIRINKRLSNLGFFDTVQEASAAYWTEANKHFGQFARQE
jgi:hypothetical protein